MAWYSKYLTVYNKPFEEIPESLIKDISLRLQTMQNSDNPLISVVVVAYNEGKRLTSCLWSLSESKCQYPMEIIGVNNNSKDNTEHVFKALGIPYYNEFQQSCGYARRCGLNHAKGKYYFCIDADTMYPPLYLQIMTNALMRPNVVAVSSLWSYFPDKEHSKIAIIAYEAARDLHLYLQSFRRPELSVRGLVFAYEIEYGRQVGYRVEIKRGEDGSMALGLKKYGKIVFVRNRKARAVTGYGTVGLDGSFFKSFKVRVVESIKNFKNYVSKRDRYIDEEKNLIDEVRRKK